MPAPTPLVLIVGPTASGKSGLAVALAQRCGGEVVSADAMAVYRGMDIGTAKPSADELAAVPHHVVSVLDPGDRCDAARWLRMAEEAIAAIHGRGRLPIVAGGTPLYTKVLLEGLSAGAPRDGTLRDELNQRYAQEGGEALLAELARIDPAYAAQRHANDQRRIVRALEVHRLTGRPYSSFHTTDGVPREDLAPLVIGLHWPRDELYRRINARCRAMFRSGLVGEVAALRARMSPEALQAVGYKEVAGHLDGAYDLDRAVELTCRNSRHLAKHQLTWYKRMRGARWLSGGADDLVQQAAALVDAFRSGSLGGTVPCER